VESEDLGKAVVGSGADVLRNFDVSGFDGAREDRAAVVRNRDAIAAVVDLESGGAVWRRGDSGKARKGDECHEGFHGSILLFGGQHSAITFELAEGRYHRSVWCRND